MSAKAQPANIAINTNTIVGIVSTLIGGIVLYMVTTGMSQVKATAADVKEVKSTLPFMQRDISTTQADVKQASVTIGTLITRNELDNKHKALQETLKDNKTENEKHYESLAGELKEVKNEQARVRENLMQKPRR